MLWSRRPFLLQFARLEGASTVIRNVIGFDPLARAGENGAGAWATDSWHTAILDNYSS